MKAVILDEPGTEGHIALGWRRGAYLAHVVKAWLDTARHIPGLFRRKSVI